MIVSWLTYCLLISTLLGVAGLVAERALVSQGWPTRWAWVAALAGSLLMPVVVWLVPSAPSTGPLPALPGELVMMSLPAVSAAAPVESGLSASQLLVAGWVAVSASLLVYLMLAGARLWLRGRRWGRRVVDGVDVLVSRNTGPAAMGLVRGRVVVPEWALGLDGPRRRLLVLHESEHVRAGDPQLASAALIACALMPWNLPLWWQLARLRLAIEVDCDGRVLRRSQDRRGYGSLLLEVGQRRARLALGLAESKSMLERRIRMIARATSGRRTFQALGLAAVSALVLAVACETPSPAELGAPDPSAVTIREVQDADAFGGCEPAFYVNGEPVERPTLEELDPDLIESVDVFKYPTSGEPESRPDGLGAERCGAVLILLNDASLAELGRHRRVKEILVRMRPESLPERRSTEDLVQAPVFTPFTVRPALRNAPEVRQALMDAYPPLLRDAGIGGTTNVWFFIDEEGRVRKTQIKDSSGREELDAAALRVADIMEFTAAYNRDIRVPVWIALDITFETVGVEMVRTPEKIEERLDRARAERSAQIEALQEEQERREPAGDPVVQGAPTFTPMTVSPQLQNVQEVQQTLMRHYPPLLRDAGIGGTTNVWIFIDEEGRVRKTQVKETSGWDAFDEAALRVVRSMEFTPAYNRDRRVPVWIALDITFEVQ